MLLPDTRQTPPRIEEILSTIKDVFVAKGFDGASMQDLARAASMSAGNFYRYFDSKDAIIEAIVTRELAEIEEVFAQIMLSDHPREAFLAAVSAQMDHATERCEGALWAEIEAAASKREAIAAIRQRMEQVVIGCQLRVFARISGLSLAETSDRYMSHAAFVLMLVRGSVISSCNNPTMSQMPARQGVRALVLNSIDSIMSEIASAGKTV